MLPCDPTPGAVLPRPGVFLIPVLSPVPGNRVTPACRTLVNFSRAIVAGRTPTCTMLFMPRVISAWL